MPLFRIDKKKLEPIKEKPFELEKEIQQLIEENLREIFGIEFIASEFGLQGLRIDTLAFDPETKSFVVVEYKRDQSFSVIDQGFSYLSLLLNNKAEFVLEYNSKKSASLSKDDIDWSQTRVVFISRVFTAYQQSAINFKDLPIELWELTRYANDVVLLSQVKTSGATASINTIKGDKKIQSVSREVKSYTEEEYLAGKPKGEGRRIYELLKEKLFIIDPSLSVHPTRSYLAFRLPNDWRNLFACHIYRDKLRVDLSRSEPKDFKDPEEKVKYMENSFKHFHQHISYMEVHDDKELEYGIYIIRQLYDRFRKEGRT